MNNHKLLISHFFHGSHLLLGKLFGRIETTTRHYEIGSSAMEKTIQVVQFRRSLKCYFNYYVCNYLVRMEEMEM